MANPFQFIKAWTEKHFETSHEQSYVTGTDVGSTKRALDVAISADSFAAQKMAQDILRDLLNGTLPRSVYDDISLASSGTDYTYTFTYDTVRQFVIVISDPTGDYSTTLTEINNLLDETGSDVILLEDDSELLLEG